MLLHLQCLAAIQASRVYVTGPDGAEEAQAPRRAAAAFPLPHLVAARCARASQRAPQPPVPLAIAGSQRQAEVKLVGISQEYDVGVVRVDAPTEALVPVTLGVPSELRCASAEAECTSLSAACLCLSKRGHKRE